MMDPLQAELREIMERAVWISESPAGTFCVLARYPSGHHMKLGALSALAGIEFETREEAESSRLDLVRMCQEQHGGDALSREYLDSLRRVVLPGGRMRLEAPRTR